MTITVLVIIEEMDKIDRKDIFDAIGNSSNLFYITFDAIGNGG